MRKNDKIVYFHQGYWPGNAPSTTFITFNALGFYQIGHPIQLISGKNSNLPIERILRERFGIEAPLKLSLVSAPRLFGSHLVLQFKVFFKLLFKLKFDILIVRALSFLPFALFLKKLKKIGVFFEAHDFFTDLTVRDDVSSLRSRRRYSKIEKRYLPKVDGIICVSEPQKKIYQKYYPTQNLICGSSGTRSTTSLLRREGFSYLLGYLGSFDIQKYPLDILIEALSLIRSKRIKLLLAGGRDEEEMNIIKGIINKFNLSERVKILLWQNPAQIEALKREIDVGCAILAPTFLNRISCPLKVLEYLSAGIPVLATELDGIKQIITHNKHGYLVQNRAEGWAAAIDLIYSDFTRYSELSKACLRQAKIFSWENRARRIIKFIQEVRSEQMSDLTKPLSE